MLTLPILGSWVGVGEWVSESTLILDCMVWHGACLLLVNWLARHVVVSGGWFCMGGVFFVYFFVSY